MCGIIGYLGNKKALPVLIEGLERLEYRGYDSAGIAVYCRGKIVSIKSVGRVNLLKEKIAARRGVDGVIGIAHTRWATHGKPSEKNAHPHCDCKKDIWVCHNGIIENYKELKDWLIKRGHKFRSETDTEVLPHLMEEFYDGNLENALVEALKRVRGAYAVVAISKNEPEKIVAAKNSSPLIIGVGEKEYIIASDVSAILNHTKKVIYLNDGEAVVMGAGGIKFLDLLKKKVSTNLSGRTQVLDWDLTSAQKSGYPHFMLKEIFEQPESIAN
ncbi:MAG: glutamine--fructose-6-phosphate aminotransferase, partial [Patescibacteria group bacterium]